MIEINHKTRSRVSEKLIRKTAEKFFAYYHISGNRDLSIAIVGDRVTRRLNRECLGADRTTDVLAFPDKDKDCFGEIIICLPQVRRQAKKYSGSTEKELIFVLAHGLLHLLGFSDDTARRKERMNKAAGAFIAAMKKKL